MNIKDDLISREALKEAISKVVAEERKEDERWAAGLRYALTLINDAQTSEQNWRFYYDHGYAQAKRDLGRPQGKWIAKEETPASVSYYCSVCKAEGIPITPFCPWCGAYMKGGAE